MRKGYHSYIMFIGSFDIKQSDFIGFIIHQLRNG